MSKRQIARLFVSSLIGALVGPALMGVVGGPALVNDVLLTRGADLVGVRSGPADRLLAASAPFGPLVILGAAAGLLISWVAALLTTARLEDKTWFLVLLITGVISLGVVGMVLYLVAGPDHDPTKQDPQRGDSRESRSGVREPVRQHP